MPSVELHDLTLAEAAGLISVRKLSPVEYTESLLVRTEALEPQLNAFITRTPDLAMAAARTAEAEIMHGNWRGPLHGVPYALKDIYDTAGILTSGHSRTCMDRVPDKDATTVARLKAAGAVLTGKLATHEFAHGGPSFDLPWPPARNPWNTAHFTGGSSSGSGAALAARLVPASLGSDTGGSIRGPAGLCGIAGLKPTYGLVSRAGVLPNSYSYDHCGPMARTSQDCALLLNAIAGHDPADPASSSRPVEDFAKGIDGVASRHEPRRARRTGIRGKCSHAGRPATGTGAHGGAGRGRPMGDRHGSAPAPGPSPRGRGFVDLRSDALRSSLVSPGPRRHVRRGGCTVAIRSIAEAAVDEADVGPTNVGFC
jgi:Asp-tRNA(Asn)/Glu-tRNA(Gln) amidotransferase A subunit family amidase